MANLPSLGASKGMVYALVTFTCIMVLLGLMYSNIQRPCVRKLPKPKDSTQFSSLFSSEYNNYVDNGQPELDSLRANTVSTNLASVNIDKMTDKQVEHTFHSYLDNTDVICSRRLRMGNLEDGGWEICDDPPVRPTPPCVVYSFGIHNDWSFDDDISKLYRCNVFSFDPSMKVEQHNRSLLVHFYAWGLGGASGVNKQGWQMYTLGDIRKRLGHAHTTLDVLKFDIENSEWATLVNMLNTGQLTTVRQLLTEFHLARGDNRRKKLKTVQALEKAGFRRFFTHKNMHCPQKVRGYPVIRTACYEVHYIRV